MPRPSLGLATATALGLWACATDGVDPAGPPSRADDARLYAEIAARPTADLSADLATCQQIGDEATRGDCALMVVHRAALADDSPPEEACDQIAETIWRNECYFVAAEHWAEADDPGRAAALCARAGTFSDDCAQHLWQGDLQALIARKGSARLPERLDKAQRLYDTWLPHLGATSDFGHRFWRRYYEMGFEPERHLELAVCEQLPGHHRDLCRLGGARVYLRRLHDRNRVRPGGPGPAGPGHQGGHLCELEPVDLDTIGRAQPGMGVAPDPLLQAVLEEQHGMICSPDGGQAGPSQLVGPDAFKKLLDEAATP